MKSSLDKETMWEISATSTVITGGKGVGRNRGEETLGRADVTITLHFHYGVPDTICIVQEITESTFQPSNCFELLQWCGITTKLAMHRLNTPEQSNTSNLCWDYSENLFSWFKNNYVRYCLILFADFGRGSYLFSTWSPSHTVLKCYPWKHHLHCITGAAWDTQIQQLALLPPVYWYHQFRFGFNEDIWKDSMEKKQTNGMRKETMKPDFFPPTLTVVKLSSSICVTFEQESIHILYFKVLGFF